MRNGGIFLMNQVKDMRTVDWLGYDCIEFILNDHFCQVICPRNSNNDNKPWVWRTEFLGAFAIVDMALLDKGWHIAYCRVSDQYGCPSSIEILKTFHDFLVSDFKFSNKADIFGFSRGGLYGVNYAVRYPQDVSVLYLDAPVLDIRSWPCKFTEDECAQQCLDCYGLTTETVKDFDQNPIDKASSLIESKIPLVLVAGLADDLVVYDENGGRLADLYKKSKGDMLLILKPNCGHHPHSVTDPTEIVNFIENHR